jgi:hypothetical protein
MMVIENMAEGISNGEDSPQAAPPKIDLPITGSEVTKHGSGNGHYGLMDALKAPSKAAFGITESTRERQLPSRDAMNASRDTILSQRQIEYDASSAMNLKPKTVDLAQQRIELSEQHKWYGDYARRADLIRERGLTENELGKVRVSAIKRAEKRGLPTSGEGFEKQLSSDIALAVEKKVYRVARDVVKKHYDAVEDVVSDVKRSGYSSSANGPLRSAFIAISVDREDKALSEGTGGPSEVSQKEAAETGQPPDFFGEQLRQFPKTLQKLPIGEMPKKMQALEAGPMVSGVLPEGERPEKVEALDADSKVSDALLQGEGVQSQDEVNRVIPLGQKSGTNELLSNENVIAQGSTPDDADIGSERNDAEVPFGLSDALNQFRAGASKESDTNPTKEDPDKANNPGVNANGLPYVDTESAGVADQSGQLPIRKGQFRDIKLSKEDATSGSKPLGNVDDGSLYTVDGKEHRPPWQFEDIDIWAEDLPKDPADLLGEAPKQDLATEVRHEEVKSNKLSVADRIRLSKFPQCAKAGLLTLTALFVARDVLAPGLGDESPVPPPATIETSATPVGTPMPKAPPAPIQMPETPPNAPMPDPLLPDMVIAKAEAEQAPQVHVLTIDKPGDSISQSAIDQKIKGIDTVESFDKEVYGNAASLEAILSDKENAATFISHNITTQDEINAIIDRLKKGDQSAIADAHKIIDNVRIGDIINIYDKAGFDSLENSTPLPHVTDTDSNIVSASPEVKKRSVFGMEFPSFKNPFKRGPR